MKMSHMLAIDRSRLHDLFIVKKESIGFGLLVIGVLIAIFGSMGVWVLQPFFTTYGVLAVVPIVLSWGVSSAERNCFYAKSPVIYAALVYLVFQLYSAIVHGKNVNFLINGIVFTVILAALFTLKDEWRSRMTRTLCVTMGCIFSLSIPAYLLFVIGVPLPNSPFTSSQGLYELDNYYLFLFNESGSSVDALIPRFQSIFMEPGHMGTLCVLLLLTQVGQWRKWYNILMAVAIVLSFSLAAYVLYVIVVFAGMWMKGKHIVGKLIVIGVIIAAIGIGSYSYNDGDNLLNQLIVSRLEMDDEGNLAGDNRTTPQFQGMFEEFMHSDDVLWGRNYDMFSTMGYGNSGYRVFIYSNGLVGVFFITLFYLLMCVGAFSRRAAVSMLILAVAIFWERATLDVMYNIIPLFLASHWQPERKEEALGAG